MMRVRVAEKVWGSSRGQSKPKRNGHGDGVARVELGLFRAGG